MCSKALAKHPASEPFLLLKNEVFTSAQMIATARFKEANTLLEQQNSYTAIEKLQQSISAFEVMLLAAPDNEQQKALIKTNISKVLFKLGNAYSISGDIESALIAFDKILGGGKYSSEEQIKSEVIKYKIKLLLSKISNAESSQVGLSIIPEVTKLSSALSNIDTKEIILQAQNMWRLHDDGMRLLAEGKKGEALQKLLESHAIQINPTNLKAIVSTLCDIYYENGDRYLASSDWGSAVAEYTECIKLNPSNPHYRIKLAEALTKIDNPSATIAAQQAIELGATGSDLKFAHEIVSTSHAKVEFDDLKKMHTSKLYEDLISLSNDAVAVIVDEETGRTSVDRISERQILKLLDTVSALDDVINALPVYYVSSDGVLVVREKLLSTMINAYNVLGTYAEYRDRLDDADHCYDKAIEHAGLLEHKTAIDIFTAKKHTLVGVKLQKSGDYARAVDKYNEALELNPGGIEARERMEDILQNHLNTPSVDLCMKCVTESGSDGIGVVKACDGVIKMTVSNLVNLGRSAMNNIQQCGQEIWSFVQSHPEIAVTCACNIAGQNLNMLLGATFTENALGGTEEL
jgi:tetratricopeptide (TPR) repeat protein